MSPEVAQAMAAHVAKGHADAVERDAADAKRAAEEKRERIWEAIYAAALVRFVFDWMAKKQAGGVLPESLEGFDGLAKGIADLWRETVVASETMSTGSKG